MTYGLESSGHDLGSVVDRKDNVCHTCMGKCLDLVLDHGLVAELDKRFGESESLNMVNVESTMLCAPADSGQPQSKIGTVREVAGGYRTLQRE